MMKPIAGFLVTASLIFGSGCARPDWIEQTLVTVDVTGAWRSTEGGLLEFALEQRGSKVKGSYRVSGTASSGAIEGTVEGDVFRFRQTSGTLLFEGEMTVSGDEMSGDVGLLYGRRKFFLQRVNSSSRPSPQQQ
jgi:hypothetical protein